MSLPERPEGAEHAHGVTLSSDLLLCLDGLHVRFLSSCTPFFAPSKRGYKLSVLDKMQSTAVEKKSWITTRAPLTVSASSRQTTSRLHFPCILAFGRRGRLEDLVSCPGWDQHFAIIQSRVERCSYCTREEPKKKTRPYEAS